MERRKYRNPPIEEAVCDLQFAPGTEWDPTMPGRIYEKLKDTYNEKPRQQQVVEAQVQGTTSEGSPSLSLQHRFGKTRVQLLAEGGTRIVGVGPDQITVHMLRPYTQWEDFRPKIWQALAAYREVAEPEGIARVGLRYINRITLDRVVPVTELGTYFMIPPRLPETGPPTRMLAFFNRKEAEFLDKPIRIVVTFADMEPRSPDQSAFLLDIDIISIMSDAPLPLSEIEDVLEDMKTRHRQVFESLITDESRRLFDAD
jgi:uncharacterized protein (TIGR04255 family)